MSVEFIGRLLAGATLVVTLLVSGCSQAPRSAVYGLAGEGGLASERSYRLGVGDKLKVVVFGEAELSGDFEVGAAGDVSMPLIGEVRARGLSIEELREGIRRRLERGYLKSPKVSVQVLNYRSIYLHGEVKRGGELPFKSGLTVADAVAAAGGFTYRADTGTLHLRREGEAGERELPLDGGMPVMPGDNIRIPERFF